MFYVYAFLDPLKGMEPFYVGKGKGRRAWTHTGNTHTSNRIKVIRGNGLKHVVKVIRDGLSEATALKVEAHLIQLIGRVDLATGPLTNWHVSGADQRIVHKTHHARACSASQTKRFAVVGERVKARETTVEWLKEHPEEHKALVVKRHKTLRTEGMRRQISESVAEVHRNRPEVTKAQQLSRTATQEATNYYAKISRKLGGKPIEVIQGENVSRFDSQHQVARFLGCYPARVNAALHKRGGRFSETTRLRFVPEEVLTVQGYDFCGDYKVVETSTIPLSLP